ncbi:hypothetical protein [Streptomyces atratus]|uniref:hypothetical protein n=1 Tax=Streptomyces atratus TaxID=1893 RepID=UPI0033E1E97F
MPGHNGHGESVFAFDDKICHSCRPGWVEQPSTGLSGLTWFTTLGYGARLLSGLLSRHATRRCWTARSPPPRSRWAGCRRPEPDRPAFRTALPLVELHRLPGRIMKGGETIDEEWR